MFLNYNYDVVIIGGGVSGLFLAYKLIDTNLKVILIEGDNKIGGRIQTIDKNGTVFEGGAARFHSSHGKLISLIHDLNLENEIIKLPSDINHILRGNKTNFPYSTKNKLDYKELLERSFKQRDNFKDKELQEITFFQYLTLIYDHETAKFIQDSFGYDSEIIHLNASAALQMFESDFFKEDDYFILKNGLYQLIQDMNKKIIRSNILLKKGCTVVDINDDYIITDKGDKFYFKNLICAIPKASLQKIPYFEKNKLFNSVSSIPLLRIYAKYPTENLWFKKLKRTITDNHIRHIIPISEENGLIMISYTDGKCAEMWLNHSKNGDEFLINALHKEIKDLYQIEPPQPEFISVHHWKEGLHVWNTGVNINEISGKVIQPDETKNIYVCGESYSKKQGWIEGPLDTCYSVLYKLLPKYGYKIVHHKYDCDIDEDEIAEDK